MWCCVRSSCVPLRPGAGGRDPRVTGAILGDTGRREVAAEGGAVTAVILRPTQKNKPGTKPRARHVHVCTFGYWTFEGLVRMFKAMYEGCKTLYLLWGMYAQWHLRIPPGAQHQIWELRQWSEVEISQIGNGSHCKILYCSVHQCRPGKLGYAICDGPVWGPSETAVKSPASYICTQSKITVVSTH